jgi:hypothetical protein
MLCQLCGQRRARRACPALGRQICAVCCGTKRLVEIRCPADCAYLETAREHPPAVVVRRQQHDLERALEVVRDFNERQSQIFLLVTSFILKYQPPELLSLTDSDVADAAGALGATFETAARGLIYEHPASSGAGARLAAALKPPLKAAGQHGGTSFERDAAVVLRRLEDAARRSDVSEPSNPHSLLELLARVISKGDTDSPESAQQKEGDPPPPRLIVP